MIFENSICSFSYLFHFDEIHFFKKWKSFFSDMIVSRPEIDNIWYREAYIYVFDQFQNLWFGLIFVIFIIFGGLDLCVLECSFLLEHFSFKMQAGSHTCTWAKIMLTENEWSNIFQNFTFRPKKCKRLSHRKSAISWNRPRITL